jgi:cytochrome P450
MLETLRLYTPLVHIARQVHGPQSITTAAGATYQFPPQTTVYINLIALHLDPRVWRNLNLQPGESPSDRDELEFRPSRWLNPVGADAPLFQPPRGTYMPWSAGPRVCPGLKMAQVEFTSILLTLFRRHFIEAVPLTREGGRVESAAEIATRLDEKIRDSMSIMTLQMKDVYDVTDADGDRGKGVKLRIRKRN